MDDGKQFAERYLNNDLSYDEYIDFLYNIEVEKDKEKQKKVLNPSYIIKENRDTSLFSKTLGNYFAEQRGISVSPSVIEGKAMSYGYDDNVISYKLMNLYNRTEYPLHYNDFIHETEHGHQNVERTKFENKYKTSIMSFLLPKAKEITEGLNVELSMRLFPVFLAIDKSETKENAKILIYADYNEVGARLKEKDVINKSLSIILNDKNTLNQKLMLLQQYKDDIRNVNRFYLNSTIESTLSVIGKECTPVIIEELKKRDLFSDYRINKDLITVEFIKQRLTEGALKVNEMVEETLRQIDNVIDECKNIQDKFAEQYKEYKDVAEIISISVTSYDFINKNLAEIRNRVSYLNENYSPDIFNSLSLDISSLASKLSEMYRQFDTDKREDALSIKKDIREFFVKLIKSQHLSFFIDNEVNDFVYGEFITKELNYLPISDIEKENIRNKVFRIKQSKYFINQTTEEIQKNKNEILHPKFVSSMPIGDAVLNDEEVVIKEETDIENRKIGNVKEVEEWEEI